MAVKINLNSFKAFFRSKSSGGIILIFCVALSLLIANSTLSEPFKQLLDYSFGIKNNYIDLHYSLLSWINDGLMAIFFLLIGLEIKRELVEGELSTFKHASLPVIAATGGAILPAIIYFTLNKGTDAANGWGIPMATDIAFALAVISLLGSRVPASLKIFLVALAIVDDLIAILVIAIFYTHSLHLNYLFYALAIFGLLIIFNRMNIRSIWIYIIPGVFIWYFIHHSGVHATIAGVLTAMTLPTTKDERESALEKLEHLLNKPVNFIIMPLFALANTNISFGNISIDMLSSGLSLGIIAGLLAGKPVGIFASCWLTIKLKIGKLPSGTNWTHIIGAGLLGGIGFTMSIFIALLSLKDKEMELTAKITILATSVVAGLLGYAVLRIFQNQTKVSSR